MASARQNPPLAKRQHVVPRFYLEHFVGASPVGHVWTYDIQAKTSRSAIAKNTAITRHTYSVPTRSGSHNDALERKIAEIEGAAAPVYAKILAEEKLSEQERADFASFVAIMYVRSPYFRRIYTEHWLQRIQLNGWIAAQTPERWQAHLRQYEAERGPMTDEARENLRQVQLNPGMMKASIRAEISLLGMKLHDDLAPLFRKMRWTIITVDAAQFLITGDSPVVHMVPTDQQRPFGGGFLDKHSEVTFPLSGQKCLLMRWDPAASASFKLTDLRFVNELNALRAFYAERFLFADRNEAAIAALGQQHAEPAPGVVISGGPEEFSPVQIKRRGAM